MKKNSLLFSLLLAILSFSSFTFALEKETFPLLQGPLVEVNDAKLTIHMIPHSHDDIGWLKTIDEYYIDSQKHITIQGVQYILDSVVPLLDLDSKKRFMYVEMGFFQRWWEEQEKDMQDIVRRLVQNGQFEFVGGGYCMNDEATVYYEDSIDQMAFGHQFLLKTFGVIPQVGWHIDPFGHASAQSALYAQMGFKAFFFSRIDYQDKNTRLKNKGMEMVWIPETSQGIENAMFTHINYYSYSNPVGCNFDILGDDQPVQDNPNYSGYNVMEKSNSFISWFKSMQASYLTTDLFHTAGDDFQYMAAGIPYKNYDKLFKSLKKSFSSAVDVAYRTPIEYLKAINPQNKKYPLKTDDFFPYADEESAYWTGYFTSRVAFKGLVRQAGQFLQAAKRLATQILWEKTSTYVSNNFAKVDAALIKLEDAMAAAQHHDAVTGTAKEKVNADYKLHFARGLDAVKNDFLYPYFKERVQTDLKISGAQFDTCNLNSSAVFCPVTFQNLNKGTPVLISIYNSGPARDSTVRVKVPNGNVQVKDENGIDYPTDIICSNSTDITDCDLFFSDSFGGFGISYYYLVKSSSSNQIKADPLSVKFDYPINTNQTITATNYTYYTINYCTTSSKSNCYQTSFNLAYNYYESFQDEKGQPSGAYIFRPNSKTKNGALSYSKPENATIYRGKNLIQVHLHSSRIITDMRIYGDLATGIEVQTFVNSIPVEDDLQGKEVVLEVVTPSIKSADVFYTDSMGMEMQKRIFNYRPSWSLKVTEPVAGNYYPVQSTIMIQDKSGSEALAIIPDRAQGGSSIRQGQIELMIHRRIIQDDYRGVDEALNEYDWDRQGMRQWVTHTLLFTKPGFIETSFRQIQYRNDVALLTLFTPTTKTPFAVEKKEENELKFGDFDSNIKLLSRPLSTNKFMLRFQNMHETKNMTVPTIVFSNSKFKKGNVVEMSLTYNQPKVDMIKSRLNWNGLSLNNPSYASNDYLTSDKFLLRPQEIRTFVVSFEASTPADTEFIEV